MHNNHKQESSQNKPNDTIRPINTSKSKVAVSADEPELPSEGAGAPSSPPVLAVGAPAAELGDGASGERVAP